MEVACQNCGSTDTSRVMDLGHHPPSDGFLAAEELDEPETRYPLRLVICRRCELVQLNHIVDPEILFTNSFIYRTGENNVLQRHFGELVDKLVGRYEVGQESVAVDIGSNDGTLLANYPAEVTAIGVDPSAAAQIAIERGVTTHREFFTPELSEHLVETYGEADIVTCTNTFAHVTDLDRFLDGIDILLADDGVFVQESHYLRDMVEALQYDEIYLEHLRYYSLASLTAVHENSGLEVFDAARVPPHGGSIQTHAARPGTYRVTDDVGELLSSERKARLNDPATLRTFADQAAANRLALLDTLTSIRSDGDRVVGIGAAAKGVSLLNYCNIGPALVEYIAETNEDKIGSFAPGVHIPIVDEAEFIDDDPDYALLLAWNLADILIPKLREKGFEGAFIIPKPDLEVIK